MAKLIMDVDVDLIAMVFSKTLRGLPVEGYGIRRKELSESACSSGLIRAGTALMEVNTKWKSVMQ